MEGFFLGSALFLSLLVLLSLIRVVFGPSIFNRIVAINVVGTKTVVMLALIGMIHGRVAMFVDICLAYVLLNFISTLAAAKYLECKEAME
ncbi:MAG: monovalent cation/H+ antiporter complex subunit F [Candidatus Binatia bacterium]